MIPRRTRCVAFLRALLAGGFLCLGLPAQAQIELVPPGLSAGAQYRLVYVTRLTRSALPTDINVYDQFVQGESDDSDIGVGSPVGDITWRAIGSTEFVDAIDHIAGPGPIYRLDGVLVSPGADDLWDGAVDVPINIDSEGDLREVFVYTGTDSLGVGAFSGMAPVRLGDSSARMGDSGESDIDWVETGFFSSAAIGRAFYAISDPLTVPATPVPAHPAWMVGLVAGLVAASAHRLMRRTS